MSASAARIAARRPIPALTAALALLLGGCVLGTSDNAPATDASGKPLIEQPLPNEAVAESPAGASGKVDFSCTTDADCAVKDVGNCCGYYPACVNVDSPTFPEQVKADCAKNDMMSTCGFADIEGCQCIEGRCAAGPAGTGEAVH